MAAKVRLKSVDEGLAEARCGRGAATPWQQCSGLLGWVYWTGMELGVGIYRGPAEFQPAAWERDHRKDGVLAPSDEQPRAEFGFQRAGPLGPKNLN